MRVSPMRAWRLAPAHVNSVAMERTGASSLVGVGLVRRRVPFPGAHQSPFCRPKTRPFSSFEPFRRRRVPKPLDVKRAASHLRLYVAPEPPASPPTLEQAFREHSEYVARVATRLLGRSDEVDDLVQDVFLRAMRDLPQLREPAALRSWLATVAARMAGRRLRMRKLRRFFGLDGVADYEALADPAASPEQRALLSRVYRIMDGLPVELRVAWALRYAEGEQLDAVARICSCSLATAKRRIGRAQELIERAIADG